MASIRWLCAAAAFAAPLVAFGYYAGVPEHLGITVTATLRGVGSIHSRYVQDPALHSGMNAVPPEAAHLFDAPFRGPRADRYLVLTRSERGVQPESVAQTKIAKAPARADMTMTGSLPSDSLHRVAAEFGERPVQADIVSGIYLPSERPDMLSFLPKIPVAERTSASLFLSMLSQTMPANPPNGSAANPNLESTELPSEGNGKRRLAFKGETETEYQARQRRCLATAIYFEARGEPVQGQLAVAQVVLNRVRSSLYPDTICGVVYQGQNRSNGCQFSFTCDGHTDVPKDKERWHVANQLAYQITKGDTFLNDIGHATHYHANYVSPGWRRELNKIKKVGRHIFYRVRGEQIEDVLKDENPARGLAFSKSG